MLNKEEKPNQLKQTKVYSGKLIRVRSVIELTGLSKSYIYDLCNKNLFPKSIRLVPGGSSVAWVESEIMDWIDSRVSERNSGVKS
jgi:prophage regulatory protein